MIPAPSSIAYCPTKVLHHICFFFFNDTATTEIYTLSLHDALPISSLPTSSSAAGRPRRGPEARAMRSEEHTSELQSRFDLVCRLLLEKKNRPVRQGARHRQTDQPPGGGPARGVGPVRGLRGPGFAASRRDATVLAVGAGAGPRHAAVAAGLAAPGPEPWHPTPQTGRRGGARARGERRRGSVSATTAGGGAPVIQLLLGIVAHAAALLLYPGLATMAAFGAVVELA